MTRREKGLTCISNLVDQSQNRQMEAPNFGLYPLLVVKLWHLCLFGH